MAFNTISSDEFLLKSSEESSGSDETYYSSVLDSELTALTAGQRTTLTTIVWILCILSVCGNLGSLYANQRRKLRLFFRTCLVSLAMSDLITTIFLAVGYLSQFGAPYVQVWNLGGCMCGFVPFVTTGAILVSSMTLVGIALDRYFAVMKAVFGFWNPKKSFCVVYAISSWALSFGIASPMYSAYSICHVYIIMTVDKNDDVDLTEVQLVKMCISEKESTAYYYVVVLAIIFVPTLVAFVWLNSTIANKLWIRRHSVSAGRSPPPPPTPQPTSVAPTVTTTATDCKNPEAKQMEMIQQQYGGHPCHCQGVNKICTYSRLTVPTSLATPSTTTTTKSPNSNLKANTIIGSSSGGGNNAKHISSREARHLRMFTIVLILMAVFIFFRLPAWIFLIMRMYGTYTRPVHWILHYSFGILTMTSCVLNPLLYTFLAETIEYAMFMKGKLCGVRRYFGNCCTLDADGGGGGCFCCLPPCENFSKDHGSAGDKDNEKMSHSQDRNGNQKMGSDNVGDAKSNDGAKSTSSKSDDDSRVYTIMTVGRPGGGHATQKNRVGCCEHA